MTSSAAFVVTQVASPKLLLSGDVRRLRFSAQLAVTDSVRRKAYRLRYQSYLASGFIQANPTGLFQDEFDELPNSKTILIYSDGRPIGSARTCFLSKDGSLTSPARKAFPDEVDRVLRSVPDSATGPQGVEICRLVRSPEAANNQGVVFLLYRLAQDYLAKLGDIRVAISCVRQNHANFYKRLGFTAESEPRPYPGLNCQMQMLACPVQAWDAICSQFPIVSSEASRVDAYDGFLDGKEISISLLPEKRQK